MFYFHFLSMCLSLDNILWVIKQFTKYVKLQIRVIAVVLVVVVVVDHNGKLGNVFSYDETK